MFGRFQVYFLSFTDNGNSEKKIFSYRFLSRFKMGLFKDEYLCTLVCKATVLDIGFVSSLAWSLVSTGKGKSPNSGCGVPGG